MSISVLSVSRGDLTPIVFFPARPRPVGSAADRLRDVHAPAGLDIKAVEPEEIALSIIGQIVALRRAGQIDAGVDDDQDEVAGA